LELAEKVMSFIESEAMKQSSELAKTRGKFANWENSIYKSDNVSMRNATVTTIAPTGTISIIAGCSSGIEPYYSIVYERNVLDGTTLKEVSPLFEKAARENDFYSEELIEEVASKRSLAEIEGVPNKVKSIFLTAADISPEDHIKMQAVFQRHSDSSVSKTINFAESASKEDVRQAFLLAYDLDCKGVTIYRDFSRPHQVLSIKSAGQAEIEEKRNVKDRPQVLEGFTEKVRTGYGNLYVTVNVLEGKPFEVFAQIGHSGYTTMADTEAICRMISLALRSGIEVGQVVRQLRGIGGSSQSFSGGARIYSIPDAIAQVLSRRFLPDRAGEATYGKGEICPDCGQHMTFESGCFSCAACGYSTC
ncbi:MAG: vitamin B12-dependent ribonucleotide reductase, partial [Candidatus Zixiibacteriota bacterium]